jgi:hypothetical protein
MKRALLVGIGVVILIGVAAYLVSEENQTYPSVKHVSKKEYDVRVTKGDYFDTGIWVRPGDTIGVMNMDDQRQPFKVLVGNQEYLPKLGNNGFSLLIVTIKTEDYDAKHPMASQLAPIDHAEKLLIKVADESTEEKLLLRVVLNL